MRNSLDKTHIFTPEQRERILQKLLDALEDDPRLSSAIIVGSGSYGFKDDFSDIDITIVVRDEFDAALVYMDWLEKLYRLLPVKWHFKNSFGGNVFLYGLLLEHYLEIDISFQNMDFLIVRRPHWKIAFDRSEKVQGVLEKSLADMKSPDIFSRFKYILGETWYYMLHSAFSLERGEFLRSRFFNGFIIDYGIEIAGFNQGLDTGTGSYLREAHKLAPETLNRVYESIETGLSKKQLYTALRLSTGFYLDEAAKYASGKEVSGFIQYKEHLDGFINALPDYSNIK